MGVDLLLARLNHWQEFHASARENTGLSSHQFELAGLAARWRRLQLAGWGKVIDAALQEEANRSAAQWHGLYTLLFCAPSSKIGASDGTDSDRARVRAPPDVSELLPVFEEFLQSATLGQFQQRLDMLSLFGAQCGIIVAAATSQSPVNLSATSAANTATTDATSPSCQLQAGWRALEVATGNVVAYYAQHAAAVQAELHAALASVKKELKARFLFESFWSMLCPWLPPKLVIGLAGGTGDRPIVD